MMRSNATLFAGLTALTLSACGSPDNQTPDPVESAAAVAAPEAEAAPAVDPVAAGKAAFAVCSACHAIVADAPAGIGPSLKGVVGRKAASVEGYEYSAAMSGSGITWTEEELDAFLTNPAAKVPGTKMVSGMTPDAERRSAIIAYLASLDE